MVGDLAVVRWLARRAALGVMDLEAAVGQPGEECQPLVGYPAMAPPGAVPQTEEAVAGPMVLTGWQFPEGWLPDMVRRYLEVFLVVADYHGQSVLAAE